MKENYTKIILGLLASFLILLGVVAAEDIEGLFTEVEIPEEQRLDVSFLDVGQGDAILIQTPYDQNIPPQSRSPYRNESKTNREIAE